MKYKLTEKYIEHFGVKLFQIQAVTDFGCISKGDLGGYIQSEQCLSQSGDAWVYDNAQVYGDARVYDNAWVSGNARVYDNAQVSGDARVSGNARVSGDARVYGRDAIFWASRVGSENGTLTVTSGKDGLVVTRGCFTGTKEEFLSKSAKVHDEKTQREYRLLIEVAESRINHHKAPEPTTAD